MPKLVIGFITYGEVTAKYLPYFLDSLKNQTYKDFDILVIDNTDEEENDNRAYIKKNYSEIEFKWDGGNIGFSRAYNKMIKKAINRGASLFLMLNPDMILEENAIEKLVKEIDEDGELSSVAPKILQWDFKNKEKTNRIDSLGIALKPGLRFVDIGQGKIDKGQCEKIKILGPSGAAGMFRLSALQKVAEKSDRYFEEMMFMYKEDCDLVYRLYLNGFKSRCICDAVIYHDRSAAASGEGILKIIKDRKTKSDNVRAWSFLNQQIIFCKYWGLQNFQNKLNIIYSEIKIFCYIILRERFLLKEVFNLFLIRKKIKPYKFN
jgi:GT2 family glycosyltransferase